MTPIKFAAVLCLSAWAAASQGQTTHNVSLVSDYILWRKVFKKKIFLTR